MKFFNLFLLMIIFSTTVTADPCDRFFVRAEKYLSTISENYATKFSASANKAINSLSVDDKVRMVELSKSLKAPELKTLQKTLNDETEIFLREGKPQFNKMFIEAYNPGFARQSYDRFKSFTPDDFVYSFKLPKFKEGVSASAIEKKYRLAIEEINAVFKEQDTVFKRMQEFEDEILARSINKNKKFYTLSERQQAEIKQSKMIEVMDELEVEHGFVSANPNKYVALDLENKSYSMEDWQNMLTEGKIFNDTAFKSVENAIDLQNRTGHGYFTHRIQFHILMKEMNKNPKRFKGFRGVELYKKLGDTPFAQKMGLANSGSDTLWQNLFDSMNGPSYHRPEYFRTQHELYPFLGAWL